MSASARGKRKRTKKKEKKNKTASVYRLKKMGGAGVFCIFKF